MPVIHHACPLAVPVNSLSDSHIRPQLQQTSCMMTNTWRCRCASDCLLHATPQVCNQASRAAGVVHGDTLFVVGNLQSPDPEERPVLPTTITMCQYHFPSHQWTRLKLRGAPEICHYPLLAAHKDQLILFGGNRLLCCYSSIPVHTVDVHIHNSLHGSLMCHLESCLTSQWLLPGIGHIRRTTANNHPY